MENIINFLVKQVRGLQIQLTCLDKSRYSRHNIVAHHGDTDQVKYNLRGFMYAYSYGPYDLDFSYKRKLEWVKDASRNADIHLGLCEGSKLAKYIYGEEAIDEVHPACTYGSRKDLLIHLEKVAQQLASQDSTLVKLIEEEYEPTLLPTKIYKTV